ncbi:uncharacterized protein LOC116675457 [Etheostoma spectabile]|uniref:uncharacterized protein LOC116675457 n=1 Tax=Etheostoma spectabile TaxID=54343 RepID=UPI0013AF8E3E|nr:uncharacterized protein LOC116675457 [Etheostoma spectabile]
MSQTAVNVSFGNGWETKTTVVCGGNQLLSLWSSTEIQHKLDGAVRTKPVFERLQNEMSVAGYQRSTDQLINKIKKLKKDYRDQKKELGRSGSGGQQRRSPYFYVLDSILGDRPACQTTGALNSATALLEAMVNGEADCPNASVRTITPPPQDCSSPVPSASVSSRQARRGKKREHEELLDYMEKADDKFLQLNKDMVAKMEADTSALLGLMGRMVAVMEAQAQK